MSKLVVFDVDGTILDSFGLFMKVVGDYSTQAGLPQPCFETIRLHYAHAKDHDFKWGVSREEQERHLINAFNMMDRQSMSQDAAMTPKFFDGVLDGLAILKKQGHNLAIVTSKGEAPLLHLLDQHKAKDLFSAHRTWDDIARRGEKEKPAPDMLQSVMRELGYKPHDTVMIGDTTMDIRMGRAAAASTIGVTWGSHPKDHLLDAGAHHIVDRHFDDVVSTVKKIFS